MTKLSKILCVALLVGSLAFLGVASLTTMGDPSGAEIDCRPNEIAMP